jgi:hypothetical protein
VSSPELDAIRRSAPMAPPFAEMVRELLHGFAELLAEHERTAALWSRLSLAWIELRNVLNALPSAFDD